MKLIPEQLTKIEEKIVELNKSLQTYESYITERNSESIKDQLGYRVGDTITEFGLQSERKQLDDLKKIIEKAEIVDTPSTDSIGIGTYFKASFFDDEPDEFTLVEDLVGLNSSDFISSNSPFGKSIYGKKVGEKFSYTVKTSTNNSQEISGRITSIGREKDSKANIK